MEIYRESVANLPSRPEIRPPGIQRAETWPYPDLRRVWVRVETSPFSAFPNLGLSLYDPANQLVSQMFLVEIRQPYQSLTLHLRQDPQEGGQYRLEIELVRDDQTLDTRAIKFDLTYRDPDTGPAPERDPHTMPGSGA